MVSKSHYLCFPSSEAIEGGPTSEKHIFARQHVISGHRVRVPPLPAYLPPPLRLFPPHIIQRLLKHRLPRKPHVGHRIRLPERLNRRAHPLHIVELGPPGPGRGSIISIDGDAAQDLGDAVLGHGDLADDEAGEEEGLVGEVVDVVGLVDPGVGDEAVGVGADGGLDVVLCRGEDAREGQGGGDVLGAEEEGVVVGVRVLGEGVEGEVQAGFVPHGGGGGFVVEGFEGGGGVVGEGGWGAGLGVGDEGVFVGVRVAGAWNVHARFSWHSRC